MSVGLKTDMILTDLARLCKTELPENVVETIRQCTQSYGKAKLVLHQNRYFIECADDDVLQMLLRDPKIGASRVTSSFRLPGLEKSFASMSTTAAPAAAAITNANPLLGDSDLELAQPVLETAGGVEVGEDEDDLQGPNSGAAAGGIENNLRAFEINTNDVGVVKKRCNDLEVPLLEVSLRMHVSWLLKFFFLKKKKKGI